MPGVAHWPLWSRCLKCTVTGWTLATLVSLASEVLVIVRSTSLKMPGLVVFGRRWGIASDDLVLPGAFELSLRILWYVMCIIIIILVLTVAL